MSSDRTLMYDIVDINDRHLNERYSATIRKQYKMLSYRRETALQGVL